MSMNQNFSVEFAYSSDHHDFCFFSNPELMNDQESNVSSLSTLEVLDRLDFVIDNVVKLYYQIEISVFSTGKIKPQQEYELSFFRRLNRIYKQKLQLNNPEKFDLPEEVEEDYKFLLAKLKTMILKVKGRLKLSKDIDEDDISIQSHKSKLESLIAIEKLYEFFLYQSAKLT